MNTKNHIEEMALDIHRVASFGLEMSACLAQDLSELGYRKASEVAREIITEIGERFNSLLDMLPADGKLTDAKTFIEAHWEFIGHSIICHYDAELKKKYTEGEG